MIIMKNGMVNSMKRKKIFAKIVLGMAIAFTITGCGADKTAAGQEAQSTETYTEKDNLKQAGLGGLVMLYDGSVWTENTENETESSLAFTDANGSLLGISCSKESIYQHPLDMISFSKQIYETYEGYEELEAPKPVTVQGEGWYEWVYKYNEGGQPVVNVQRFYAKNYYAYTVTYAASENAYEMGRNEAMKAMNSIVMNVPDNDEAEAKAKEFLVGEWFLGESGYLVLNEDGTYAWYMTSDKDEKNMHKGIYGSDVENSALGFGEGEGIYLVLFPEVLYADGEEMTTASAKYDYAISMEQQDGDIYQMLNLTTFTMYPMQRQ